VITITPELEGLMFLVVFSWLLMTSVTTVADATGAAPARRRAAAAASTAAVACIPQRLVAMVVALCLP
jgi:hypothetical protein